MNEEPRRIATGRLAARRKPASILASAALALAFLFVVFPIAVDTSRITRPVRLPALETILEERFVNFLFVGRIAPNKKIEDHIRLAEYYKRYVDSHYRFIFVGRYDVVPRYYSMIRALTVSSFVPDD